MGGRGMWRWVRGRGDDGGYSVGFELRAWGNGALV